MAKRKRQTTQWPKEKDRQHNGQKKKYKQRSTKNRTENESLSSTNPTKNRCYSLQTDPPFFDGISKSWYRNDYRYIYLCLYWNYVLKF